MSPVEPRIYPPAPTPKKSKPGRGGWLLALVSASLALFLTLLCLYRLADRPWPTFWRRLTGGRGGHPPRGAVGSGPWTPSLDPLPVGRGGNEKLGGETESGFPAPIQPSGHLAGDALISRVRTRDPVVFITVDDGWVRDPSLPDLLEKERIPITAFVLGQILRADPGFWRRLEGAGAVIEDHTLTHARLAGLPLQQQIREICGEADEEARILGHRPVLFRPPYGAYDANTLAAARACGLRAVVLWDASVFRGNLRTASGGPLRPGDIVLMHFRRELPFELQSLSEILGRRGLRPAHLEDYLR